MHLDELRARLTASWPATHWSPECVQAYAKTYAAGAAADGATGAVSGLDACAYVPELMHAWACLEGDPDAIATFESRYVSDVIPNLRALGFSAADLDEALQRLRERLLVGDREKPPRLRQYAGRGHLGGFVRAVAVRLGLDMRRAIGAVPTTDISSLVDQPTGDPELEYLKRHYTGVLADALRASWEALGSEQRLLLAQQIFDGLTIDELAPMYQLHRATMARRAVSARAALVEGTRGALRDKLGVSGSTVDSIVRVVASQLDLVAVLADATGSP